MGNCYLNLGIASFSINQLANAEEAIEQAINLIDKNSPDKMHAYNALGQVYLYWGESELALNYFQKTSTMLITHKKENSLISALNQFNM